METHKTVSLKFLLVLLTTGTCLGQGIAFKSEEHNFGVMKQNEMRTHEFEFTNVGKDTVVLAQPHASCGCTAALLSSSVIPPKGSGKISVQFRSYVGMVGHVEKTVQVSRLDHGQESLLLNLKIMAQVNGELLLDTGIIRFQALVGEAKELKIHLRSNSEAPLKLDNISLAVMEYIDTTAGNTYHADKVISKAFTDYTLTVGKDELLPTESTNLTLVLRTHEKGQLNGHLRIVLPNSEIRLPVVGVVLRN